MNSCVEISIVQILPPASLVIIIPKLVLIYTYHFAGNCTAVKNLCGIKLLMNVCLAQEVRRE